LAHICDIPGETWEASCEKVAFEPSGTLFALRALAKSAPPIDEEMRHWYEVKRTDPAKFWDTLTRMEEKFDAKVVTQARLKEKSLPVGGSNEPVAAQVEDMGLEECIALAEKLLAEGGAGPHES
jgi:hypothetical protein